MVNDAQKSASLEPLKGRAQKRLEERELRKAALKLTPEEIFSRVANTSLMQFQQLEKEHGKSSEVFDIAENELVAGFLIRYMVLFGWLQGSRAELDKFGKLVAEAVHAAKKEIQETRLVTLG